MSDRPEVVKRTLLLAGALLLAALLAHLLPFARVAVGFGERSLATSLPALLLALVACAVFAQAVLRLVPTTRRALELEERRARAREDLDRALLDMAAGRWSESEAHATRSADDAARPAVHYVVAARAAELTGRSARREGWLDRALAAAPDDPAPALVTRAEMCLRRGELDAALAALQALERHGRLGPRALLLLARTYRQRGDFAKLRELEPRLRDTRGVQPASVDEIMDSLYLDMLKVATERGGLPAVEAVWDEATRAARRSPAIVVAYARALARFGEPARAVQLLRALLDDTWSDAAVQLYGELEGGDALERLRVAEGWLRARRDDPALLVACARLCMRAEIYGKARSYLETSHALRPRPETAQLLAQLLEQMGERERALHVLGEGLALATGRRADLPPLRQRRYATTPRR